MAAQIIDGKKLADEIKANLKQEISKLNEKPGLAAILVGNDPASELYVSSKHKACEEVGIYSEVHKIPASTNEKELIDLIKKLNSDKKIHGILLQLPLPKQFDEQKIIDTICPKKDVDGLTTWNMGRLFIGLDAFIPATPKGVIKLIESTGINFEGKTAVVIGRSNLVGKPVSFLLQQKNCTVTMCHSKTANLSEETKRADILVVAVGKPNLITADMVKKGAVIIDVGINRIEKKIMGDVDFENVKEIAAHITPVPGGVGPVTVACLLENVLIAAGKA